MILLLVVSRPAGATGGESTITVHAFELNADGSQGAPLDDYSFILNVDNAHDPHDPDPLQHPGIAPIESHSPLVAVGDQDDASVTVPNDKYLISIRSPDHKMWGKYISLPADHGDVNISLRATPLPLAKLVVQVYEDNAWTNGALDSGEPALAGFHITMDDQIDGQVIVDYYNNPLCTNYETDPSGQIVFDADGAPVVDSSNPGGDCVTDADGFVTIPNLSPATYFVYATPPDGTDWVQTTTIDGGFNLLASQEEGSDGLGAPGETIWEGPGNATAYTYGFVHANKDWSPPYGGGTGTVIGTARNWLEFPPFATLKYGDPVANPYVALSDSSTDQLVWVGQGDSDGNIFVPNVPAGTYNVAIWDEQLSYIIRFLTVTVANGQTVDMNTADADGQQGVGISRWFGWLSGYVYQDVGVAYDGTHLPNDSHGHSADGNGLRDCIDPSDWTTCEPGIPNFDLDQRWRDGSIKEDTLTTGNGDPRGPGYYEYSQAEGGGLGKFMIGEVGFGRFGTEPGASVHDELDPSKVTHVCASPPGAPPDTCISSEGGGLLTNQLMSEGHRAWVDWGKRPYAETETGQIVGITYFGTTRNEFYGDKATNETYEAAIPNAEVRLESQDGTVLNDYITDHWQHPTATNDGQTCDVKDAAGLDISSQLNPLIGPNCLEVPITGQETKDGAFDGGYAFADYCPNGYDLSASDPDNPCWNAAHTDHEATAPLAPGKYVVHAIMPADPNDSRPCNPDSSGSGDPQHKKVSGPFGNDAEAQTGCVYRPEREEDVNVDSGQQYTPAIPGPPCAGDDHLIDQSTLTERSPYFGNPNAHARLCDKKLIDLKPKQNANADFFLMTNFENGPDVEVPGRVVGSVFDDIYFDRDPKSIWYGEPRPLGGIPVGIYDYKFRLLKTVETDENGAYEALLPSTETFNCPIPQGPCPGMYIAIVNDPGSKGNPNPGYNPNYLTANTPFDIWPGQTDQLDTPVDPVSGSGCELPTGTPELLQVRKVTDSAGNANRPLTEQGPFVRASDTASTNRRIAIDGVNFGAIGSGSNAGQITLTDPRGSAYSRTFTGLATATQLSNGTGGIVSWADRQIVLQIPALSNTGSSPYYQGPRQLLIRTAGGASGLMTPQGITVHVLGSSQPASRTGLLVNGSSTILVSTSGLLAGMTVSGSGIPAGATILSLTSASITISAPATQTGSRTLSFGTDAYDPPVVKVAPPTLNGHELQDKIDSAAANSLVVLGAGVYHENVILWKPLKLQGIGVGGTVGAVETGGPPTEDPRFNIQGSSMDGRFFRDNNAPNDGTGYWDAKLSSLTFNGYGNPTDVPGSTWADVSKGADITVVSRASGPLSFSSATGLNAARIDGIGITLGQGSFGAGGVHVNAYARNLRVTNNVLESDHGQIGGGLNLGVPFFGSQHNENVVMKYDRVIGSGGVKKGGGVSLFNGADNYEIANSVLCSNFSSEYGAGISHFGLSPNGKIHDNQIYYNDAFDSGAGIAIGAEDPIPAGTLGNSSGSVSVDRNVISANYSGDDGGGIFVKNALTARINIRNNMIVNNGSADLGGAIMLDDSSSVSIINNTIANNVSTASSEGTDGLQHSAGLVSEANSSLFQATLPAGSPDFSNPVALLNNIFWDNQAYTLDGSTTPPSLVAGDFIDFEVHGTAGPAPAGSGTACPGAANANGCRRYTPRYSDLSNGNILEPAHTYQSVPGGQSNRSEDPLFVAPFIFELAVGPSRLDPQMASVTIVGLDPPNGIQGNYHLTAASPEIDRGASYSNYPAARIASSIQAPCSGSLISPNPGDIDSQFRPQLRTLRLATPWDLGADELSGLAVPLSTSLCAGTTG